MSTEESPAVKEFSLVKGGPFYRIMLRVRLVNPVTGSYAKEIWLLGLLAWLPLLVLSAVDNLVLGNKVRIPLLYDYAALVRFLVAIPLLVAVEPIIDWWVNSSVRQFVLQDIIKQEDGPSYDAAVTHAAVMRDLAWVELALIVASYIGAYSVLTGGLSGPFATWHTLTLDGHQPNLAGWWYALFSIPFWQFLLYRWLWRMLIWVVLLWKVSRLDLRLLSTHPDLASGLGFLKYPQMSFSLVAFALSSVAVAVVGNRIAYLGQTITSVYLPLTGILLVTLLALLGPLLFFMGKLISAKRSAVYTYGILAENYTQGFDAKWVKHQTPQDEELLGTSDIQSLADLANSFNIIANTKVIPFDLSTIISITVVVLIPLIPLVIGVLPLEKIIQSVLRVLV